MFCPLRNFEACLGDDCAWWVWEDDNSGHCAITCISFLGLVQGINGCGEAYVRVSEK